MSLATDLRAMIAADLSIAALVGDRICQGQVPERTAMPYIWFQRSSTENEDTTDGSAGDPAWAHLFDMEVVADNLDDAEDIVELIKSYHLYRGECGDSTIQGMFVEDHTDQYVRRNDFGDDGFHIPALIIRIIP